jgi:hypothetical protein
VSGRSAAARSKTDLDTAAEPVANDLVNRDITTLRPAQKTTNVCILKTFRTRHSQTTLTSERTAARSAGFTARSETIAAACHETPLEAG